jgi:hypothetical protein
MKYKDLNLKQIREDNSLDFAHFTYQKGMCSCCYGPKDLPKRYWKNNTIPEGNDYTYILFKNANNGSGIVKREDEIKNYTCISWRFPMEKMHSVCGDLQRQLGNEYIVLVPKDHRRCIVICKDSQTVARELESGNCYIWQEKSTTQN